MYLNKLNVFLRDMYRGIETQRQEDPKLRKELLDSGIFQS